MILTVEWTTLAAEKEPEKFGLDRESNPGLCDDRMRRSIHWYGLIMPTSGFFFNRLGCSFNCEDRVHVHIFIQQFKIWFISYISMWNLFAVFNQLSPTCYLHVLPPSDCLPTKFFANKCKEQRDQNNQTTTTTNKNSSFNLCCCEKKNPEKNEAYWGSNTDFSVTSAGL